MKIEKPKKNDLEKCAEIEVKETKGNIKQLVDNLCIELLAGKHLMFVAKFEEEILGFINAKINDWNRSIYIQELFINSLDRGKGYGTELLNKIFETARKMKMRIVFLDLSPNNEKAMKFYLKNGFIKAGYIDNFFDDPKDPKAIILSYKL
jgi:ribosomal protein S18 acetylase RimI-like enzyme